MIDWSQTDTVLLDMDGTLLDLEFDNVLWMHRLPERYAVLRGISDEEARAFLFEHMRETRHRLEFYSVDYWTRYTDIDIVSLHHELKHLIRFRPHAEQFLFELRRAGKRLVLVTNAHRAALAVKDQATGLARSLDRVVSSHDFEVPKEQPEFWSRLARIEPFDPARTLLIDDNADVLDSAAAHGIAQLCTIAQPDSARPARTGLRHPALDGFDAVSPSQSRPG